MPKPESCRYMKSHEWVCLEGGSAVVGISDHAQHEITEVVYIDLPKVGLKVSQGKPCCVIESVKAAFDFYSPVSGEVVAVNDKLAQDPGLVNRSAQDEGWFFKVKPADPKEADSLMGHPQYQEFLKTPAAHGSH
ncbi:MAG: glycine cleavage system protein GcvH [Elusimicrobia bacterium]|nr:glycine cleavage system protein GcvH [Elusimicrobiota bacterium]